MQGTTNIVKDIWLGALQIVGYDGNIAVGNTRVDINKDGTGYTTNTKADGIATFTALELGTYSIEISKDGYITVNDTIVVSNPFNYTAKSLSPVLITFTITNENNQPIVDANISISDTQQETTDENGQAVFSKMLDGSYTYTISKEGFDIETGTIVISRNSNATSVVLCPAPINCLAKASIAVGDNVKLNCGVGDSSYTYNAESADSSNVNVLSINGVARTTANVGEMVKVRPSFDNSNINVVVDEDNADIEVINGNTVNQINVNITAVSKFLCFKNGSDYIYFENNTLPFLPNSKSFISTAYTYFTYENNVMVKHTATTSTVSADGANSYDGHTLNIDSSDSVSSKVWQRHTSGDIEQDNSSDVNFSSEGYLTDVNPIIPNTFKKVEIPALDRSVWRQILSVNGLKIENFPDGYTLWVKNSSVLSITSIKKNSNLAKDCYVKVLGNLNKLTYTLNTNVAGCTIKLWVGTSIQNRVLFETTGSTSEVQAYAGDIIYYEVSHAGYTTQSGSYTVPSTGNTYTQSITLVAE